MPRAVVLAVGLSLVAIGPSLAQRVATSPSASSEAADGVGRALVPGPRVKTARAKPARIGSGKVKDLAQAKAAKRPEPPPPWAAVDPSRANAGRSQAVPTSAAAPGPRLKFDPDAIDYGMKVNGASVSAGQTRNQNYDGNLTGNGGELGMRLHF